MGDDLFAPMAISASGLSAQRKRMEAIAKNIANAEASRSDNGDVYRRRTVVMSSENSDATRPATVPSRRVTLARTSPAHIGGGGADRLSGSTVPTVEAREVVEQDAGYRLVHEPHHPDADENGYVRLPDINTVGEMVDMMAATRAYEANLAAMKAYQSMVARSLEI